MEVLIRHVVGKIFSKIIRKTPCLLESSEYMVLTQRNKYLKQDFCSFDKNIEFLLREV